MLFGRIEFVGLKYFVELLLSQSIAELSIPLKIRRLAIRSHAGTHFSCIK